MSHLEKLGNSDAGNVVLKIRTRNPISDFVTKCLLGVTVPESPNDRVFLVRKALGSFKHPKPMKEFAGMLTAKAQQLGLGLRYHPSTVSDIEAGNRAITLDDAIVVAALDPAERGIEWLAFGEEQEVQSAVISAPRPPLVAPISAFTPVTQAGKPGSSPRSKSKGPQRPSRSRPPKES